MMSASAQVFELQPQPANNERNVAHTLRMGLADNGSLQPYKKTLPFLSGSVFNFGFLLNDY